MKPRFAIAALLAAGLLAGAPAHALVQVWDGGGSHLVKDANPTATVFGEEDEFEGHLTGHYMASAGSNMAAGTVSGWIDSARTDLRSFGPLQVHTWADVGDAVTFYGSAPVA